MKASRLLFGLLAVLVGLLAATSASAQLRELSSTRDGDGSLFFRTRNSSSAVERVSVRLDRSGEAVIDIVRGPRETIRGTWRNESDRRVRVQIETIGRDPARGYGLIGLDGRGSFTSVQFAGEVDGARFSLEFEAGRQSGGGDRPGQGTIDQLNVAPRGRGTLDFRARSSRSEFDVLRIRLDRNHSFEIRPDGIGETFRGRWWQDERGRIRIDIDRVNNDSAVGSGSIELTGRNEVRRVEFNGNVGRAAFRLNFEPGRGGDDDDDDNGGDFRDIARRAVEREFTANTSFSWSDERVSGVSFGNRTVTGRVRARGGNRPGTYSYRVVLGAGTGDVKSVRVTRD